MDHLSPLGFQTVNSCEALLAAQPYLSCGISLRQSHGPKRLATLTAHLNGSSELLSPGQKAPLLARSRSPMLVNLDYHPTLVLSGSQTRPITMLFHMQISQTSSLSGSSECCRVIHYCATPLTRRTH